VNRRVYFAMSGDPSRRELNKTYEWIVDRKGVRLYYRSPANSLPDIEWRLRE
jgi:hypothetical protein